MKNLYLISTNRPSRLVLDTINNNLFLTTTEDFGTDIMKFQNIYITNDEPIKNWYIRNGNLYRCSGITIPQENDKNVIMTTSQDLIEDGVQAISEEFLEWFVHNADDSGVLFDRCEVEKEKVILGEVLGTTYIDYNYKIIIPQETNKTHYLDELPNMDKDVLLKMWNAAMPKLEPKQETTLEEVAESRYGTDMDSIRGSKIYDLNADVKRGFVAGAKWQQEHGQKVGHNVQVERMYSEEDMLKCWNACERFERPISEGYAPNFNQFIENLKRNKMKETLEEAAKEYSDESADCDYEEGIKIGKYQGFIAGAKWRQEQQDDFIVGFLEFIEGTYSYSNIFDHWYLHSNTSKAYTKKELLKVYRKFKKKQHE
jgi:hypothetical protein